MFWMFLLGIIIGGAAMWFSKDGILRAYIYVKVFIENLPF